MDLRSRGYIPVGLALGYRYASTPDPVDGGRAGSDALLLNVSYTGRPDFSCGLDLQYERVPIPRFEEDARVFTLLASMWYYF
jgi:hypothetical protein